jgi:hypothetical protein
MKVISYETLAEIIGDRGLNFKVMECAGGKRQIFECSQSSHTDGKGVVTFSEEAQILVRDAADRFGMIPLTLEFFSANENELGSGTFNHQKEGFEQWFKDIAMNTDIWVDTNIIVQRSMHNIVFAPNHQFIRGDVGIIVPRYAVLELERLANSRKQEWRNAKEKRAREKSKANPPVEKDRKWITPGRFFLAFQELRSWRLSRVASLASPLKVADMLQFPVRASEQIIDALIRQEMKDRRPGRPGIIFLTRDLVAAISANADEISSIFVHPVEPEIDKLQSLDCGKLARLLIELAIDIGSILVTWSSGNSLLVEGLWSGKNWALYGTSVRISEAE